MGAYKMHIGFCINNAKSREVQVAEQFSDGLRLFSDNTIKHVKYEDSIEGFDLVCIIGVKSMWRMQEAEKLGIPYLYFDKGYDRKPGYWRVAINGHQPTDYFTKIKRDSDRRRAFGWKFQSWKPLKSGGVLFAGSSEKFHVFKGLPHPTEYAVDIINQIREHTKRRVIYRPKPSWKNAKHIKGTVFSREKGIHAVFDVTDILVTYGSNACFEAVTSGIPAIVLGDAVTRDISSNTIDDINAPKLATFQERERLLNQLAYCQFTPEELKNGDAWAIISHDLTEHRELILNTNQ